ncbi:MAG: hypothetical protein KDB61_07285 [Planctomycetes bacterium]|nr:hypothetical protein [Planctomycetota bacterium]
MLSWPSRLGALALMLGLSSVLLFAKDTPPISDGFASSGDSIGTLPVMAGGTNPWDELWSDQLARQTTLTMTLPSNQVRNVIGGAWGTGWVEATSLPEGQVRLAFHGNVQLVVDEVSLQSGLVHLDLTAGTPYPWFYALQIGAWQSGARAVGFSDPVSLDVMPVLAAQQGGEPVRVLTMIRPGIRGEIAFQRGSGLVEIQQIRR